MSSRGRVSANNTWTAQSIIRRIRKYKFTPIILLAILIASYIAFFGILTIDRHNRFGSNAYDLGIMDQQIWHHSRFITPFNTIRGMHVFGDHFRPLAMVISPLYWFFDDVRALLLLQVIILAAAAIPLFLIAKHYFKNSWIPLVFCFSYLIFPGLHWTNLEDFHFEAFIPLFILLMFYFLIKEKKFHYLILLLLALLVKEEVAVSMFLIGIYVYFKHDKKLGIFTSAVSLLWFLLVIYWIIPFFAGESYISMGRIVGYFGDSPLDVILSPILQPGVLFAALLNSTNAQYIWQLFSPVAFLAILNPATLIISASLWANLAAAWPYAASIKYHYVLMVIPFIFLSTVIGLARFKKKRVLLYILLSILMISSLISNYNLAPQESSIKNYERIIEKLEKFGTPSEEEAQIYRMLGMIPKNASVSAFHSLVPHLTRRNEVYMFPNPFEQELWGTPNTEYPPTVIPDYLLLRKEHAEEKSHIIQPLLENGTYYIVYESEDYELLAKPKALYTPIP